jgi:hemoglobin
MNIFKYCLLIISLYLSACTSQYVIDDAFYDELGGKEGVRLFVTRAVELYHSDKRIAFLFENTDDEYLIEQIENQMCYLSGGSCEYEGLDMRAAHSGLEITEAEFDIFVELFIDALEYAKVPHTARYKLLAKLAPMREDIIHQ